MTITIPRPSLVILAGPSGSGKSTFADAHFRPTEVVSSDACRALISDQEHNQRVSGDAFALLDCILHKRLKWRRLALADSTALRRSARRHLLRIAHEHRVPAVLILFDIPLEVCLRRDLARARLVGEDVIRKQFAQLEEARGSVHREGFDHVYVLTTEDVRHVPVLLVPRRAPGRQARPHQE